VVECQLPKLDVAGSNPVARSYADRRPAISLRGMKDGFSVLPTFFPPFCLYVVGFANNVMCRILALPALNN
jgi:hypothetical protein